MRALERVFPASGWIRRYSWHDLPKDLTAAAILASILIPQGMAYALLAGLPPQYGLYASTVPVVLYALFGTSRHLPVGPYAITSLLTFTAVSSMAQPGSSRYISLVLLLALMVGVVQLVMGLARMGFIVNFVSHPVLSGFIYASAITIMLSQVGALLGLPVSSEATAFGTVLALARGIGGISLPTATVGLVSLGALMVLGRLLPRVPAPLVLVVGSTLAVYLFGLRGSGVEVIGAVRPGLPDLSLPVVDTGSVRQLLPSALIIAFVGFISSISAAKEIATKENYKIDSSQELRALGVSNASASLFSGFPVAGSLSRIAVSYQWGARTQLAQIGSALLVVVALLFFTPTFEYLPNAALAAVILAAVSGLLDVKEARRILKARREDGLAFILAFVVTLLVGVEEGVIAGAVFALLAFIRRTAYPTITELGYVAEEDAYLDLQRFPQAETYPGALIVRFEADLYFANISFLEEWLISRVPDKPQLEWIVINCRGINSIDVTAVEGLERLISDYRERGIELILAGMKLPVSKQLERAGWSKDPAWNASYRTTRDALRDIGLLHGTGGSSAPHS